MDDFPEFMRNPRNAIDPKSQSRGNVGYVYDGIDGSQMAIWTSTEDVHPVRNDALLLCSSAYGRISSQNNSGGVRCPLEFLTGFMTMTNISS